MKRTLVLMALGMFLLHVALPLTATTAEVPNQESETVQGEATAADDGEPVRGEEKPSEMWLIITMGFAMAIASAGCGLAQAKATAAAVEGMARNPGAAPAIRFALLFSLILIESMALYTFVLLLIAKFI